MNLRRAQKLMSRLHLTRKIHTMVNAGLDKFEDGLKQCSMEAMPAGWSTEHDKELLLVCDEFGIDNISTNILSKPDFQKIIRPPEKTLLRRVIEVCTTCEAGKWSGAGNVDAIEESDTEEQQARTPTTSKRKVKEGSSSVTKDGLQARGRSSASRKRGLSTEDPKVRALMQQSLLSQINDQTIAAAMIQSMLLPSLMSAQAGGSSSAANSQQQQLTAQLLQLMGMSAAGTSTSNSSAAQQQQQQQQLAVAMLTMLAAASGNTADLEALGLVGATKKTTATPSTSKATESKASTSAASSTAAATSSTKAQEIAVQMPLEVLAVLPMGHKVDRSRLYEYLYEQ